jgi:hypothetical protein
MGIYFAKNFLNRWGAISAGNPVLIAKNAAVGTGFFGYKNRDCKMMRSHTLQK